MKLKKLNFKKWLKSQGVDTKYFWKSSRRKDDQDWYCRPVLVLGYSSKPHMYSWVFKAFRWSETKQGHQFWEEINDRWERIVGEYDRDNSLHRIKFGFKKGK